MTVDVRTDKKQVLWYAGISDARERLLYSLQKKDLSATVGFSTLDNVEGFHPAAYDPLAVSINGVARQTGHRISHAMSNASVFSPRLFLVGGFFSHLPSANPQRSPLGAMDSILEHLTDGIEGADRLRDATNMFTVGTFIEGAQSGTIFVPEPRTSEKPRMAVGGTLLEGTDISDHLGNTFAYYAGSKRSFVRMVSFADVTNTCKTLEQVGDALKEWERYESYAKRPRTRDGELFRAADQRLDHFLRQELPTIVEAERRGYARVQAFLDDKEIPGTKVAIVFVDWLHLRLGHLYERARKHRVDTVSFVPLLYEYNASQTRETK